MMTAENKNSHDQTNHIKRRTLVLVTTTVLVACLAVTGATTVSAQSEVVSEFDNDAEGWTVTGDAQTATPTWEATGGNPDGHIVSDDSVAGGVWYWNASERYLGDKSGFLNGTLEYDLRVSANDSQFSDDDIVLEGGGTTLVYDHGDQSTHPRLDWTEYEVVLNASDDGWTNETGGTPTRSEFDSVLSSLSSLEIRGEYKTGSDTGRLDNVVLGSVQESTPSVTASGGTASPGGSATVTADAQDVISVAINDIPNNWSVASKDTDGGLAIGDPSTGIVVSYATVGEQSSVSISFTFDIPSDAPIQDNDIEVVASSPNGDATDTATVSVQDCPADPVVCSYDPNGDIGTSELQQAITDFIQNNIDTGDLQAVINAFVQSQSP